MEATLSSRKRQRRSSSFTRDEKTAKKNQPDTDKPAECISALQSVLFESSSKYQILPLIFSFASHSELALQLSLVCRLWNRTANLNVVWEQHHLQSIRTSEYDAPDYFLGPPVFGNPRHFQAWKHIEPDYNVDNDGHGGDDEGRAKELFRQVYQQSALCSGYFEGIEKPIPSLDVDALQRLQSFQKTSGVELPLAIRLFLSRSRIDRLVYHLGTSSNLDYANLEYFLFENKILLPLLMDEQGCWTLFCMFEPCGAADGCCLSRIDPPVYSLSNEPFLWHDRGPVIDQDLEQKFREHLVLEQKRWSVYMEQYALESRHWGLDAEQDDESSTSSSSLGREEEETDQQRNVDDAALAPDSDSDGATEYETFGIRQATINHHAPASNSSSDEETEWDGSLLA